jgi:hypothetical protein
MEDWDLPESSRLLAWIEPRDDEAFLAAFVGKPVADRRAPATQLFASPDEARQWIEHEAAALGLPVEWVSPDTR